jgi:hypothetical protein
MYKGLQGYLCTQDMNFARNLSRPNEFLSSVRILCRQTKIETLQLHMCRRIKFVSDDKKIRASCKHPVNPHTLM